MTTGISQANAITVVIQTFNRLPILRLCLQYLEAQTVTDFDVIVVNDGSTDGTEEALIEIQKCSPLRLRILSQQNAGPARGRNFAIGNATTNLCLLIGDDILASPGLLEAHLRFHRENPNRAAVGLGWTKWDQLHQDVTPFMQWYEEIQFDYGRLTFGLDPTWHHFYTSNLSFKTDLVRTNPFDERFKRAAWEDIELGYRLITEDKAHLTFLREALATHVHPTTFLQAVKRMQTLGSSEHQFHQIWPAARNNLATDTKTKICAFLAIHPLLLESLTLTVDRLSRFLRPGKLHAAVLRSHQLRRYLESHP
ncbi:glycosyltransferase family 2 protein [Granulicella sp. L60]|uniref:glycosyltransferase family 2 protein n=1 Tax=Granulicella sp. L60 TaxID=1641866 RepID=UPI00131E2EC1|nr:glycosyltransferase family 2 protein [Granulicella sp. L60]